MNGSASHENSEDEKKRFTGMLVSFRNVSYTVRNSQNKKEEIKLLDNIMGYLRPGELVSLMGPSGSGKTTLLDVLAGRKTVGKIEGEILYSGNVPTQPFLRRFTGYVEQFDSLVDLLTVYEMLLYTAELKLPLSLTLEEKKAAVEEVISALALDHCRDTRIGSALAGTRAISKSDAKRVNIGIALVSKPRVLFLDEPTTGLDSFTANEVMTVIRKLSRQGITVCATIHAPTHYIFSQCDRLLMLLRGQLCYFGKNGDTVVNFFHEHHPDVETLTHESSLAEWIVDLTTEADRQGKALEMAQAFRKDPLHAHAVQELEAQLALSSDLPPETRAALDVKRATETPLWWGVRTLLKYRGLRNYTSPDWLGARIGPPILNTFLIFTIFWQAAATVTPENVVNIAGVISLWVFLPSFGATAYIPSIMLERVLFTRERNDGLYTPVTFLTYKLVEEFFINIALSAMACVVVWFAVGFAGLWPLTWLVFFGIWMIAVAMTYFICSLAPNIDFANAAVPTLAVLNLLTSTFFIRLNDIGWWWRWYTYINFVRWGFAAQMANFFSGDRDVVYLGGQTVTQYFSVDGLGAWAYLGFEYIFFVVFFGLAILTMTYVRHDKR